MKREWKIVERGSAAMFAAAGILFVAMMLGVNVEVVSRYFFHRSIHWLEEAAGYSLLYMTFLAAPLVLRRNAHISLDLALNHLGGKARALINAATSLLGAVICWIVTWYSVQSAWENFHNGARLPTLLEPPKFVLIAIIPVGCFMLTIEFLLRSRGYWSDWKRTAK